MGCLSFIFRKFNNHAPHSLCNFAPDDIPKIVSDLDEKPDLINLPIELIIHVVSFLPQESTVLLGLVSRRSRSILLRNRVSLSFDSPMTKRKFLLLLTRDTPEYLACRVCNHIFRWQRPPWPSCPCRRGTLDLRGFAYTCVCFTYNIMVRSETIDLVLRSHEQGLQYGLPLSYLNHDCEYVRTCEGPANICSRIRASMIDGQVFIIGQYKIILDLRGDLVMPFWPLNSLPCRHVVWGMKLEIRAEIQRCLRSHDVQYDMGLRGCPKCATDYRVKFYFKPDDHIAEIEINSWRNFGGQYPEDPCVANMFWPAKTADSFEGTIRDDVTVRGPVQGRNLELQFVTNDVGNTGDQSSLSCL